MIKTELSLKKLRNFNNINNPSKVLFPMERVRTLINKLQEQAEQNVSADKMLVTAQMLLAELQGKQTAVKNGNITVVMPNVAAAEAAVVTEPAQETHKPVKNGHAKKEEQSGWLFDPVTTVPTLIHQNIKEEKEVFELNDVIVFDEPILNSKLKEHKTEVADVLQGTPIKDLRKSIGVNDRYLIVNELFRGDETMFERSLKTINGFTIYPEAEYWIQRELKVKLSWNESSEAAKLFDQFIKRRFS